MSVTVKRLNANTDRTGGEEIILAGNGLIVSGLIPHDLEISLDGQTGDRIPFSQARHWRQLDRFTRIWVFHTDRYVSATPDLYNIASGMGTALVLTAYSSAEGAIPVDGNGMSPVPLVRFKESAAFVGVEEVKTPEMIFTTYVTNTGATVLSNTTSSAWRWRVFGYRIALTGDASMAAAGMLTATLTGGIEIGRHRFYLPAAPANVFGGFTTPWIDLKNGFRGTKGSALTITLSSAIATGSMEVQIAGMQDVLA